MHPLWQRIMRCAAVATLLAMVVVAPPALADDWARDQAAAQNVAQLDPAIRAAIRARSVATAPVPPAVAAAPAVDDGFAWGAAAVGLGVGVVGMCALFGCVALVRHDGRLRNA